VGPCLVGRRLNLGARKKDGKKSCLVAQHLTKRVHKKQLPLDFQQREKNAAAAGTVFTKADTGRGSNRAETSGEGSYTRKKRRGKKEGKKS